MFSDILLNCQFVYYRLRLFFYDRAFSSFVINGHSGERERVRERKKERKRGKIERKRGKIERKKAIGKN
jgi:hypothetical protein